MNSITDRLNASQIELRIGWIFVFREKIIGERTPFIMRGMCVDWFSRQISPGCPNINEIPSTKHQTPNKNQWPNSNKFTPRFLAYAHLSMIHEKILMSSVDSCIRLSRFGVHSSLIWIRFSQYLLSLASLRDILIRMMKSFLLNASLASI